MIGGGYCCQFGRHSIERQLIVLPVPHWLFLPFPFWWRHNKKGGRGKALPWNCTKPTIKRSVWGKGDWTLPVKCVCSLSQPLLNISDSQRDIWKCTPQSIQLITAADSEEVNYTAKMRARVKFKAIPMLAAPTNPQREGDSVNLQERQTSKLTDKQKNRQKCPQMRKWKSAKNTLNWNRKWDCRMR